MLHITPISIETEGSTILEVLHLQRIQQRPSQRNTNIPTKAKPTKPAQKKGLPTSPLTELNKIRNIGTANSTTGRMPAFNRFDITAATILKNCRRNGRDPQERPSKSLRAISPMR